MAGMPELVENVHLQLAEAPRERDLIGLVDVLVGEAKQEVPVERRAYLPLGLVVQRTREIDAAHAGAERRGKGLDLDRRRGHDVLSSDGASRRVPERRTRIVTQSRAV
jgi:hypothetical protein